MPDRLGSEICRELKKIHTIPILLFSAHTNAEKAYADCNADGFINKPFDIDFLLSSIKKYLQPSS